METLTEDGGGDSNARASWMVLTQLVVRHIMSFVIQGVLKLREAHLPQCRLETRMVVVIPLVWGAMLEMPSRGSGRVLRENG